MIDSSLTDEDVNRPLTAPFRKGPFASASRFMARNPWIHFVAAFVGATVLSYVGVVIGEFSPEIDNEGWMSRGTRISDRSQQYWILYRNTPSLAGTNDNEDTWVDLTENPQPNFSDSVDNTGQRRLLTEDTDNRYLQTNEFDVPCKDSYFSGDEDEGILSEGYHLSPIWQTDGVSAFDPQVILDICEAEQNTMNTLFRERLCETCDGKCLAPVSIVMFARVTVGDNSFALSCSELADSWKEKRIETEEKLFKCVEEVKETYSANSFSMPDMCPPGFYISMVDEDFSEENNFVGYTSSRFPTYWSKSAAQELYDIASEFDKADDSIVVQGAYDNERESLGLIMSDGAVGTDMLLACGSGIITTAAILLHTRSPWLTIVGLFQIIFSFPLSYFVYTFLLGWDFFPFLNFIGVFVVFALGADDIFVAVDKWKNARLDYPNASIEQIAAIAFPDAAGAMLLTTTTTAAAFFGTAICPVAPLKCFAIFVGLLIVFDYLMCILLVFPALCIYDKHNLKGFNCFCSIGCSKRTEDEESDINEYKKRTPGDIIEEEPSFSKLPPIEGDSLIRRIILGYYSFFHKIRWIIFFACLGGTAVAGIFAARLELPKNSDVRLLGENVEYELNWSWRLKLLSTVLDKSGGNPGGMIWGVTPADTGSYADPSSGSVLVLDRTFDPSTLESQEYLLGFCDRFFEQEFASLISKDFVCPYNAFNEWLVNTANGTQNSEADNFIYDKFCEGATDMPLSPEVFNPCISAWAVEKGEQSLLLRNGEVKVIFFFFQGRVRFDSPFQVLDDEWNLMEEWLSKERMIGPNEANKMYQTSIDFWWFDTNGSMLRSAYASAGIALAVSGLIVFISSRSFILTLFALITIAYVLASTTAMLVASGWTLGFLESICFAILIGISCDFVIHFCHAYAHLPGEVDRHYRTKFALVRMGPSILAAAFTTICSAAIMLFTVISFFQQFALILFYTIIQATIGSFVVFTAFTDCIGPSNPTYLVDSIFSSKSNNETNRKETIVEARKEQESQNIMTTSVTTGSINAQTAIKSQVHDLDSDIEVES